jgi:6-pyruvoyltetrahydropterin/6-carboxytetrahydropterin synthase
MRVSLTSRHHFEAAHRLENPERDEAWNREVFDKCHNEHGHGHTYRLEVTVEGPIDSDSGYVLDFRELKSVVEKRVIRAVERRHLNFDVEFLRGVNPTAENIAVAFWKELDGRIPGARLKRITLHETRKNSVIFEG